MKPLKISLPDDLRAQLETVSTAAGRSVAEEVRHRLSRSLDDDGLAPETRKLMAAVGNLSVLVKLQTGHDWHSHPASGRVFRRMITARLARLGIKSPFSNEAVFQPGELPGALLVDSEHPDEMGAALEAIEFHTPPMTDEHRRRIDEAREKFLQELRDRQELGDVPPIRRRKSRGGRS